MEQQAALARYERLHEQAPWHDGTFRDWAKESDALHPYHFTHGVTVWVASADLSPDDHFLTPALFAADDEDEGESWPTDESA